MIAEVFPKDEGSKPHIRLPDLRSYIRKTSIQKVWFKRPMGFVYRRAIGNGYLVCKEIYPQNSITEETILKKPESDSLPDLRKLPRKRGANLDSRWEQRH